MKNHYSSPLLAPISIGNIKLKNRLAVLPMLCIHEDENGYCEQAIAYYEAKAKGGWGLIFREGSSIYKNDKQLASDKELCDRVHAYGAKIIGQYCHPGRQMNMGPEIGVVAPSPIPCMQEDALPRELSIPEIKELVKQFGRAALFCKKAGYDGFEIHGAHGYLIAQFMSFYANKRVDEYGGSLNNRMRFALEIIKEVRKQVGFDYTISFRISADEFVPGGRTIEETKAIAIMLEKAGIDVINVSGAVYGSLENYVSPMNRPVAYLANLAAAVKEVVNIPVITGDRINDPQIAESLLVSGMADIIGMGRASLADPDLPNKFFSGNSDDIRTCIGCNQGCIGMFNTGQAVACLVNPRIGHEHLNEEKQAEHSKKVAIVGGGPGGMYAAIAAARVGHNVTVYEKERQLGGQFLLAPIPPEKGPMASFLAWQIRELNKLGISIKTETEFTEDTLEETKPDAVIIATGSVPSIPKIPGIDNPHVVLAADILQGKIRGGDNVVVAGGGMIGAETATHLKMQNRIDFNNREVTIVEMLPLVAQDEEYTRRILLMELLEKQKIAIKTNTKIVEIKNDHIMVENNGEMQELPCDMVVLALGMTSNKTLYEKIKSKTNAILIGDAKEVRNALKATREGYEAGLKI